MKVLITGRNGFLGKELTEDLKSRDYEVTSIGRSEVNLTDPVSVRDYFKGKHFDAIVHTAFQGGKRNQVDTLETFINNVKMFNNLVGLSDQYSKFINFCSGAAFDRNREVYKYNEERFLECLPTDYYGMSKNIIAREITKLDNVYNLRILGCFGIYEDDTRFVKSSIKRAINGEPIIIHQNRMMDFISTEDVSEIVNFYLVKNIEKQYRDINLCYPKETTLKSIASKILDLTNSKSKVIIEKPGFSPSYTANSKKLEQLDVFLKLGGLNQGLENLVEKING